MRQTAAHLPVRCREDLDGKRPAERLHSLPFPTSMGTYKSAATTAAVLAALGVLGLSIIAVVSWLEPSLVADRFKPVTGISQELWTSASLVVARQHGAMFLGLAIVGLLVALGVHVQAPKRFFYVAVAVAIASYLSLCWALSDWLVDDAGVTFAYSENLVLGHGLVLYPGYSPQEAYSNTLWMLTLAGFRALGVPIPMAAKVLGALAGIATLRALEIRVAADGVGRTGLDNSFCDTCEIPTRVSNNIIQHC